MVPSPGTTVSDGKAERPQQTRWLPRGLIHRAKLDDNVAPKGFCISPEETCVEVTDKDGIMTKDIALTIHGKDTRRGDWAVTDV